MINGEFLYLPQYYDDDDASQVVDDLDEHLDLHMLQNDRCEHRLYQVDDHVLVFCMVGNFVLFVCVCKKIEIYYLYNLNF